MQEKKKESGQLDRRRLLKGTGLAIGAAGAGLATKANSAGVARDQSKPQHAGYRESEDVLTYYKLARR
jgi:hypothetical protein